MTDLNLILTDELTNKEVTRTIDITNIMVASNGAMEVARDEDTRRSLINDWICERGNLQHETILTLKSYSIS